MGRDDEAGKERIECRKCGERFLHQRSLVRHLEVEHGPKVYYRCRRCSHKNNRKDNLRYHYRDCHPDNLSEVSDIKGEVCEPGERPDSRRVRRAGSPTPPIQEKTPSKSPATVASRSTGATGSKRAGDGGSLGTKKEASRKRARKESADERPAKKRSGRSVAHTVSRAPRDEATMPADDTPREVSEQRATPVMAVTTPGVVEVNKPPVAGKPPDVAAWEEIGGLSPLVAEGLEMDQLQLSPTPMSLWESDDTHIVASAKPKTGGKPISMMKLAIQGEHAEGSGGKARQGVPKVAPMLKLDNLLPGQAVKVKETRETYLYREGSKLLRGETQREFDVVYLRPVPRVSSSVPSESQDSQAPVSRIRRLVQCPTTGEQHVGPPLREEGLEQAMLGRVTKVMETSSRVLFQDGQKIMKDKTQRVYDVSFLAGISTDK